MAAQLQFLSPWIKGLLVPGSTGDGWELTDAESQHLLDLVLAEVQRLELRLLVGALRPMATDARHVIHQTMQRLQSRAGTNKPEEIFSRNGCAALHLSASRQGYAGTRNRARINRPFGNGLPLAFTSCHKLPSMR